MKKQILFAAALFCSAVAFGQGNVFNTTGNAGAGTTTPQTQLHVYTGGATPLRIERFVNSGSNQNNFLDFYFTSNPITGLTVNPGSAIIRSNSTVGDMVFVPGGQGASNGRHMILSAAGNLNLGTITHNNLGRLNVELPSTSNQYGIYCRLNSLTPGQYGIYMDVPTIYAKPYGVWTQNVGETFAVWGDGRTFIGVERPNGPYTNAMLSVGGMMTAKEIYVQTSNWADYVFEPGYTLKSLEEVEAFIQANGHLPNVPSAQEIVEKGHNLADTDRMLLEKVEELTLYMIDLKKELDEVKAENAELKGHGQAIGK